jgi:hypothetical protein
MSFLDEMRKDHPALKKKPKDVDAKDHAAMYNALTRLAGCYTYTHSHSGARTGLQQMIACSKMIEQTFLTSRKKRIPCDLAAIRSYIVTELGADLSLYEVRMLLLFVSIYRMDPVSKKKGYTNLMPPPRQKYEIFCRKLNDLVAKCNEPKKPSAFPHLARMNSKKILSPIESPATPPPPSNNNLPSDRAPLLSSLSQQKSYQDLPSSSVKISQVIRRTQSEPVRFEDKEDDSVGIDSLERTLAFRAQTANLAREASRRNMLGTIDYTPSIVPPIESCVTSDRRSKVVHDPKPLMYAPSFNDKMDKAIFGDATSMDTILRPDENGDVIPRPRTAIAREKIRFQRESQSVKNEVFRMLKV